MRMARTARAPVVAEPVRGVQGSGRPGTRSLQPVRCGIAAAALCLRALRLALADAGDLRGMSAEAVVAGRGACGLPVLRAGRSPAAALQVPWRPGGGEGA